MMSRKPFSSPREEALDIAFQLRNDIISNKTDAASVLRGCLAIASNLNKQSDLNWISRELKGYGPDGIIPEYRKVSCRYKRKGIIDLADGFEVNDVGFSVHILISHTKKDAALEIVGGESIDYLTVERIENLLAAVIDRCLLFLISVIGELQYGGVVENLMEEIRRKTDEKLAVLDTSIAEETHSLYLNLMSTNPADWIKVGHSCRRILKLLADKVFPSSTQKYTMKNGKVLEVLDSDYINRLCAFLDKETSAGEKKLVTTEMGYLEGYIHRTLDYAQMVEHSSSIEKLHADMLAIHTYLVASEILRYVP